MACKRGEWSAKAESEVQEEGLSWVGRRAMPWCANPGWLSKFAAIPLKLVARFSVQTRVYIAYVARDVGYQWLDRAVCYSIVNVWLSELCLPRLVWLNEICVLYQQQALLGNCDTLFMTLPHEHIREFHKQWYLLTDCALEIFLNTGKTCLLAFNQTKVSKIHLWNVSMMSFFSFWLFYNVIYTELMTYFLDNL